MVRLVARLAPRAQTSIKPKCRHYHQFNHDLSQFIIPETQAKRHLIKPFPLPTELDEPDVFKLACNLEIPSRVKNSYYMETAPAFHKWFKEKKRVPTLNTDLFKEKGGSSLVPLEYLGLDPESNTPVFRRFKAPLATFASFVEAPSSKFNLYLAQCDFESFPESLQRDLDFYPRFLKKYSSEKDIYGRNIWIGTPPTYSPLHRDPNHNYYQQMASVKKVRLMSPAMGLKVYSKVANTTSDDLTSQADPRGRIRTEEMMSSPQREDLYRAVWENQDPTVEIYEGDLSPGHALFIPAGWWHSFKSDRKDPISASLNYWFQFSSNKCRGLRDLSMRRRWAQNLLFRMTQNPTHSLRRQMIELSKIRSQSGETLSELLGENEVYVKRAERHYRDKLRKWGYIEDRTVDLREKATRSKKGSIKKPRNKQLASLPRASEQGQKDNVAREEGQHQEST